MASTQALTKFPHLPNGEAKFKSPPPAHIATKAAQELRKKDDLSSKGKRLRADVQKVLHTYL